MSGFNNRFRQLIKTTLIYILILNLNFFSIGRRSILFDATTFEGTPCKSFGVSEFRDFGEKRIGNYEKVCLKHFERKFLHRSFGIERSGRNYSPGKANENMNRQITFLNIRFVFL